jgi:hypothetical protein
MLNDIYDAGNGRGDWKKQAGIKTEACLNNNGVGRN